MICTDDVNTSILRSQPQQPQYTYVTDINILIQLATMTFLFVNGKKKSKKQQPFWRAYYYSNFLDMV